MSDSILPKGAKDNTKWVTMDSSLYKTNTDLNGESVHYAVVMPSATIGPGLATSFKRLRGRYTQANARAAQGVNDFGIEWKVVKQGSNFVNSIDHTSNVQINALTPLDQQDVVFSVSNIQKGEVVYLSLIITVTSAGEKYEAYGNHVIYREDPINTNFRIFKCENGRLINEVIFDSPIEKSMLEAIHGTHLHTHWSRTDNGSNPYIKPYLRDKLKNLNKRRKVRGGTEVLTKSDDEQITSTTYGMQFIQDEYKMYAHGREVTESAILTLNKQNPDDALDIAPTKELKRIVKRMAIFNRTFNQPVGYNGFTIPLFNPSEALIRSAKLYFPGRSSHGTMGVQTNSCSKSNNQTNQNSGFYNNQNSNNPNPNGTNSCYRTNNTNNCCQK